MDSWYSILIIQDNYSGDCLFNVLLILLNIWYAWQTGVTGAICLLDDEPTACGRHCGPIDSSLCQSQKVSFSIALMIQPESGPVCLLGTEFQKKVCWEILVAGAEQGIEAGQVGLRLITKGDRQMTVAKEWSISATSIADGRFVPYVYILNSYLMFS